MIARKTIMIKQVLAALTLAITLSGPIALETIQPNQVQSEQGYQVLIKTLTGKMITVNMRA